MQVSSAKEVKLTNRFFMNDSTSICMWKLCTCIQLYCGIYALFNFYSIDSLLRKLRIQELEQEMDQLKRKEKYCNLKSKFYSTYRYFISFSQCHLPLNLYNSQVGSSEKFTVVFV